MFKLEHADYHLHTWYSDGEYSPSEVIEKFYRKGIRHIAITDHDGIDGVLEGEEKAHALGMEFLRGIEFSTSAGPEHSEVHILGYNMDMTNEAFLAKIEAARRSRRERNDFFIRELTAMEMPVTHEELQKANGHGYIGKPVFARVLLEKGYISSFEEGFSEKVFGSARLNPVRKNDPPAEEIVEIIRNAGGIPVLAHPGIIEHLGERGSDAFYAAVEKLVRSLIPHGLQGMECIYRKHSKKENERFTEMAERNGLLITTGSDFHNERK